MHILFVSSYYPSETQPTRASYCRETALALMREGYRVGVLVAPVIRFWPRGWRWAHFLRHLGSCRLQVTDEDGLPTYRCRGSFPFHWARVTSFLTRVWGERVFQKYCREEGRPDVIHAHFGFFGGALGAYLKKKYGIPVVLTEHHSQLVAGSLTKRQKALLQETFAGVDRVVAVAPPLANAMKALASGRPVEVIGNFVDPEIFFPNPGLLPEAPFVFTLISNLYPVKAVDMLLEAFSLAFADSEPRLCIVGDGPEREKLERLAGEKTCSDQISFLGCLPHEQIGECVRASHVIVCASRLETFGLPLIEGMACGKPVVATRCGGPEHLVTSGNGLLVEPDDPQAMADALREIHGNYHVYDGRRIHAECMERFGLKAVFGRYRTLYERATAVNRNSHP
ncbi:MAG: glycosyltransferase [Acidobacteriota bacterium]|nr:glycosyltransferase [Acidobacteriota bacterium]